MLKTFEGEQIVSSSDNGYVTLTTHRISMESKEFGRSYYIAIFLEDISSIQMHYRSFMTALWIGIFAFTGSIYTFFMNTGNYDDQMFAKVLLFAAIISVAIWLFSKRRIVSIYPNGGKPMEFLANQMSHESIQSFLAQVQLTKAQRIYDLYKVN
jgi:hypothetical protein